MYLIKYCDKVLNVLNVILNFLLMNRFLSGKFSDLGWRWLKSLPSSETFEPSLLLLSDVFPKMTVCTWKMIGTGGRIEVNTVCFSHGSDMMFWFSVRAVLVSFGH